MLELKKVAVTGGLACGKSTVCQFFKELGAYVVSADEIVHQLLSSKTTLSKQIIELIGPDIVANGQIDRSQIAKKVFNQPKLLQKLENLLHPAVYNEIMEQYKRINNNHQFPLFVAEIPLLFESGGETFFDAVVTVIADPAICKARFQKNSGKSADEYEKRSSRQLNTMEKAKRADYTIFNDKGIEELKTAVKAIYNQLAEF